MGIRTLYRKMVPKKTEKPEGNQGIEKNEKPEGNQSIEKMEKLER